MDIPSQTGILVAFFPFRLLVGILSGAWASMRCERGAAGAGGGALSTQLGLFTSDTLWAKLVARSDASCRWQARHETEADEERGRDWIGRTEREDLNQPFGGKGTGSGLSVAERNKFC